MNEIQLDVEVHCLQPRWVADEHSKYRLYLNGELLTERDWIWTQETYIQERVIVDIARDTVHSIGVEVIKCNPTYLTQFALKNLKVNGTSCNTNGNSDTLYFNIV